MKRVHELTGLSPGFPHVVGTFSFCPQDQEASGCEGTVCWVGASAGGRPRHWGDECGEKRGSVGLRSTLPGKSKPKY